MEIGEAGIERIDLAHVYADEVTKTDNNTGEQVTLLRVVLIDDKGVSYQTFSEYALRSLRVILQAYGPPPWPEPIPVKVIASKSSNKRTFYQIVPWSQPVEGKRK